MNENTSTPIASESQDNEIVLYQPDSTTSLDVRVAEETVWLTQAQIVELFASSKANVSEHLKNIFESEELDKAATVRKFRTVRIEGVRSLIAIWSTLILMSLYRSGIV